MMEKQEFLDKAAIAIYAGSVIKFTDKECEKPLFRGGMAKMAYELAEDLWNERQYGKSRGNER